MPSTSANTAAGAIRFLPPSVSVSFCKAANDPEQAASAPGPQNIETSNSKAHHGSAKHEVRLRPLWRFRPRSGFAPTDETLRRKRATTRDALEGEADIWCATRLEGGVYEKLLEYVLLSVAATELIHAVYGRAHNGDRFGVTSGGTGQLSLGDRQRVVAHDAGDGAAARGEGTHGVDHALRGRDTTRRGQRHQPVRQSECGKTVTDPSLRLVSQFLPAVSDIDAEALEAEEHRGRVLHVDVDIRRGDRERRAEVPEPSIVEFEYCVIITALHPEKSAVPQVLATLPVGGKRSEPLDAFATPALHFHYVGDGVRAPEIAGVQLDRAASAGFGGDIVADLFVSEGLAGQHRRVA